MRKKPVSHSRRPQRLMAVLAVVGIAAGGLMAMPGSARADGATWREGWCRQKEGQTVVIDWRGVVAEGEAIPDPIVRCIQLAIGATAYPLMGTPSPLADPLESAGITYTADSKGIFTSIGGTPISGDFKWQWATGEVLEDGGGVWKGKSSWSPVAGIDTMVGITLTDEPSNPVVALPAPLPQFDPREYDNTIAPSVEPSDTPSESPSNTTKPSDSASPSGSPSPSASPSASKTATQTATSTPTSSPSPTVTASPTPTASAASASPTASRTSSNSRPRRTTRPPRQTYRPQRPTYRPQTPDYPPPPPNYPPPPPVQDSPPPPVEELPVEPVLPADPSGAGTDPAAAPPSRVWGREDVTRQSAEAENPDKPASWSHMAAVAGAVVVVGGLGTAFARGLQTSTPPVVEEE